MIVFVYVRVCAIKPSPPPPPPHPLTLCSHRRGTEALGGGGAVAAFQAFSKDGFRYTPAELDPFVKDTFRAYRSDGPVAISACDKAPQLRLSEVSIGRGR